MTKKVENIPFDELDPAPRPERKAHRGPLVLSGRENQVDQLIEAKRQMDDWKRELEECRKDLQTAATDLRKVCEEQGMFSQQVVLRGHDENASLSYGNQFKKMKRSLKPELDKHLGSFADELFEVEETATVVPAKLEELWALIEAEGLNPADFLEVDESVVPKDDFRRRRYELRKQMTPEQNAAVDLVTDYAAHSPTLTVPKKISE